MKVIGKTHPRRVQGEMVPVRGARFEVRRADQRWEKGTPFNMFGDVSACGDV